MLDICFVRRVKCNDISKVSVISPLACMASKDVFQHTSLWICIHIPVELLIFCLALPKELQKLVKDHSLFPASPSPPLCEYLKKILATTQTQRASCNFDMVKKTLAPTCSLYPSL